ncbi:hypothetical protein X798_03371 [Onchocerca flexuosa]|uniref:Uncharacterized protein n=1 Tax=Onchocerca flexuosa TaxID=387005 RepID=A0A238BWI0_9BILA|nr:hypothetical protein X798_03371 [Onchocerca flexuosa]
MGIPLFLIAFIVFTFSTNDIEAQLSAMFGNAVQANNCAQWTPWGPCIWLKGSNPRWQRSYFDQLLPGKNGCREHIFFKLLNERWSVAFNNFYNYLREITISQQQCGQCSYQQSCGRQCHRRGTFDVINPLFVAERACAGVDQSMACESKYIEGCKHWPNPNIQLPNVTRTMQDIIDKIDYLTCIPQIKPNGTSVCRCCCHPYAPNETTMKCELKPYLNMNKQYIYEKMESIDD